MIMIVHQILAKTEQNVKINVMDMNVYVNLDTKEKIVKKK